MRKILFTTYGTPRLSKYDKEYFEVPHRAVSLHDIFIVPACAGMPNVSERLAKYFKPQPERVWAVVTGLGRVYERYGVKMQRAYIKRTFADVHVVEHDTCRVGQ